VAEAPVVSYAPTDEHELIRSTARQFLEERLPLERVRELMMSDDGFDRVLWKEIAELGWTGLAISEEHGGAGLGPVEMGVLVEEMGRLVTPGPFFASAVVATTLIQNVATPEQQASLLPGLASGDSIATAALFESAHDVDPLGGATTANETEHGWVISGAKKYVLDGHMADEFIVSADGGLFVVPSRSAGVTVQQETVLDSTRRQATVTFDSVEVGASSRLGSSDDVGIGVTKSLETACSLLAVEQVGGAQRCMQMAVDYAKTRYQFGRPIGSYQAVKHRCANMLMKVESSKSAAYHAIRVTDDDTERPIASSLAKSLCSDAYVWVAGENIQVHGGIGFTWEHDAHLYLKRAKASSLMFGSARHHRQKLGRALNL